MKITVIGAGYVGLVTSVGLAILGHEVNCIDLDNDKISMLNLGKCPIYEIGIEERLVKLIKDTKLKFFTEYIDISNIVFLAVQTPPADDGSSDLQYIYTAIDSLLNNGFKNGLIVIKSTVPPGTNKQICNYLNSINKNNYKVSSNPEFLKEGNALFDFLNPNRIIIGTNEKRSSDILKQIYKPIIQKGTYCVCTDPTTSELIKYSSNAFLATKIALINELSDLSERVGANINNLSLGIGLDHRIGREFLKVGPGFGGSCFPKDIKSLEKSFEKHGIESKILKAVIKSNELRYKKIIKKIKNILGNIENKTLCILGLTFKANTDDLRESPSIKIIELLLKSSVKIHVYDPKVKNRLPNDLDQKVICFNNPRDALYGTDALIIATEWEEFKNIPYEQIKDNNEIKSNIIIDLRNLLDMNFIKRSGFDYYCLGIDCTKIRIS
jgi:UDPglucose 6-dehydrogenase